MEFGLALPQLGAHAAESPKMADLRTVATAAERAGYASLWALDRLVAPLSSVVTSPTVATSPNVATSATSDGGPMPVEPRAVFDPIVALTTAAALTDRIRIGTNVLVAPLYSPVMLARTAASLDQLSGGRFTLGLGLGSSTDDFAAAGVAPRGLQVRIEEMLEVMARVWRDDVVEIENSHERIPPSTIGLKPLAGRVPLLLAGHAPAGLERIARRADGWTPVGVPSAVVATKWSQVRETAERYGRDPEQLRLVVRANVAVTGRPLGANRREFAGSIAQVRRDINSFRDIGADELILDLHASASTATDLLELASALSGISEMSAAA